MENNTEPEFLNMNGTNAMNGGEEVVENTEVMNGGKGHSGNENAEVMNGGKRRRRRGRKTVRKTKKNKKTLRRKKKGGMRKTINGLAAPVALIASQHLLKKKLKNPSRKSGKKTRGRK